MHRRSIVEFHIFSSTQLFITEEKLFPDLNLQVELASRAQRSTAARAIARVNGNGDVQSEFPAAAGITSSSTSRGTGAVDASDDDDDQLLSCSFGIGR